jgi:hypothetical protein
MANLKNSFMKESDVMCMSGLRIVDFVGVRKIRIQDDYKSTDMTVNFHA